MSQSSLIAVVDDDEAIREATQGLLKAAGYATAAFPSAEDFLTFRRSNEVACLITDIQLGGMSGLQLQRHLGSSGSMTPIIVMTAFPEDGQRALAAGALCVLDKPFIKDELLSCIRQVVVPDGQEP